MIFTGDDFDQPGGRSRLFSAVSTDREHWQLEGELLGAPGTSLYYSSLVDDHLVFVRRDDGQSNRLAAALVTMP